MAIQVNLIKKKSSNNINKFFDFTLIVCVRVKVVLLKYCIYKNINITYDKEKFTKINIFFHYPVVHPIFRLTPDSTQTKTFFEDFYPHFLQFLCCITQLLK